MKIIVVVCVLWLMFIAYTVLDDPTTEVVVEQACVNGYEWVILVNARGQSVAIEQAYKASEVPGACAQPVECQDL